MRWSVVVVVAGIVVLPFYLLCSKNNYYYKNSYIFFSPHLVRYQLIVDEIDRLKKTRLLKMRMDVSC